LAKLRRVVNPPSCAIHNRAQVSNPPHKPKLNHYGRFPLRTICGCVQFRYAAVGHLRLYPFVDGLGHPWPSANVFRSDVVCTNIAEKARARRSESDDDRRRTGAPRETSSRKLEVRGQSARRH